ADSAMYSAKKDGKNRIMYFTPELGLSVRERLNLENQLRGAIVRGEIAVHYQPEFDVATRRLVRFEALARWQHPTLGNIPPDRFIPIAEESGLIIPLGAFVLEHACREAKTWQSLSDHPIQVAVNVSTVQFRRPGFVDEVAAILRDSGLDPKLLQLELTESIMLDGTERASSTMKQLAEMGVSIAVDDFGTGYSCFSYLPRLPFNVLKIDRTFVSELDKRVEMAAMIRSLVSLAHNLNMQVVVEGIETTQQLETIEAMGGNEVQGYLLGRPTADPKSLLRDSQVSTCSEEKIKSEATKDNTNGSPKSEPLTKVVKAGS
ncbi:MAG: putative bifunctional diguanylate cyclase/phosphodiesterase, partial [Acidobacteriaceae bacterium]